MSTYKSRSGTQDGNDERVVVGQPMPCSHCKTITAHATLCSLGARCVGCFRAYVEMAPSHPDSGDKREPLTGPKAWAYMLKEREANGDNLSIVQKSMWRSALGSAA